MTDAARAGRRFSGVAAGGLLVLGLLQMAGHVLHLPALAGIAAATAASPAPKVFSTVRGLETFSTRFYVAGHTSDGRELMWPITPERYAGLEGPYNRRNVFGALLAYGPVLASDPRTRPLFEAVSGYAFCRGAPLLAELGIPTHDLVGGVSVRLLPRAGIGVPDLPLELEAPCDPPDHDDASAP